MIILMNGALHCAGDDDDDFHDKSHDVCTWLKSITNTNFRVSNVTHFGAFVDVGVGKVFVNVRPCKTHVIYLSTPRVV